MRILSPHMQYSYRMMNLIRNQMPKLLLLLLDGITVVAIPKIHTGVGFLASTTVKLCSNVEEFPHWSSTVNVTEYDPFTKSS